MTIPTFPLTARTVDFNSSGQDTPKVLENNFGDGYTQRAGDGLNNVRSQWDASWTNLTTPERDLIIGFFRQQMGYMSFYWTAPGESIPQKWTAREWKQIPVAGGFWKVTATLKQEFDL